MEVGGLGFGSWVLGLVVQRFGVRGVGVLGFWLGVQGFCETGVLVVVKVSRRHTNQRSSQFLRRIVKRSRGGLVFKARRLLHHSTLGLKVIKKKKKKQRMRSRPTVSTQNPKCPTIYPGCSSPTQKPCALHHEDALSAPRPLLFFLITLDPRVMHKSMSFKNETSSEPLHISEKKLLSN